MTSVTGPIAALAGLHQGQARPAAVLQLPPAVAAAPGRPILGTVLSGGPGGTVVQVPEGRILLAAQPLVPGTRISLQIRADAGGRFMASILPAEPPARDSAAPGSQAPAAPQTLRAVLVGIERQPPAAGTNSGSTPVPGDVLRLRLSAPADPGGATPVSSGTGLGAQTLAATVLRAAGGLLTVRFASMQATLSLDGPIAPGRSVILSLERPLPQERPAGPTAPARILGDLGREWPSLRSALESLGAARSELAEALPQPGPLLARDLARFIAAARAGKIERWLGTEAMRALAAPESGPAAEQVADDFSRIGRLSQAEGEWRAYLIPLMDGSEPRQLRLYVRDRGADGKRRDDAPARFVLEVDLSRLGALQFDGLYRSRQVNLLIRSGRKLAPALLEEIGEIFRRAMEGSGMTGDIRFEPNSPFITSPAEAIAGTGTGAGLNV